MTDRSPDPAPAGGHTRAPIAGHRLRRFLPLAAAVPILWLTLMPGRAIEVSELPWWCLVCGGRGIADGILNIALFAPLGWTLGANGWRPRRAMLAGLALSATIEVTQAFLPNRFPSLGDVLYNGAGAGLGALLWAAGRAWLGPAPRHPLRRGRAWGAVGLASILATPLLLAPALPGGTYTPHRAPRIEGYDAFHGRVLEARVAGRPARRETLPEADSVARGLREGGAVELAFRVGPPPRDLAPIFTLTRGERMQALLIGVDDRDLVVRIRTWADRVRLDRPDLRDPGRRAAWAEGDTVVLAVEAAGDGVRVSVGEGRARPLTVPSSRGWSFLLYGKELDRRWGGLLDLVWWALWAIPLGLWAPGLRFVGPAAAWAAALLLLPAASPVLSPGWAGVAGIPLGLGIGRVLYATSGQARRHDAPSAPRDARPVRS